MPYSTISKMLGPLLLYPKTQCIIYLAFKWDLERSNIAILLDTHLLTLYILVDMYTQTSMRVYTSKWFFFRTDGFIYLRARVWPFQLPLFCCRSSCKESIAPASASCHADALAYRPALLDLAVACVETLKFQQWSLLCPCNMRFQRLGNIDNNMYWR